MFAASAFLGQERRIFEPEECLDGATVATLQRRRVAAVFAQVRTLCAVAARPIRAEISGGLCEHMPSHVQSSASRPGRNARRTPASASRPRLAASVSAMDGGPMTDCHDYSDAGVIYRLGSRYWQELNALRACVVINRARPQDE